VGEASEKMGDLSRAKTTGSRAGKTQHFHPLGEREKRLRRGDSKVWPTEKKVGAWGRQGGAAGKKEFMIRVMPGGQTTEREGKTRGWEEVKRP